MRAHAGETRFLGCATARVVATDHPNTGRLRHVEAGGWIVCSDPHPVCFGCAPLSVGDPGNVRDRSRKAGAAWATRLLWAGARIAGRCCRDPANPFAGP